MTTHTIALRGDRLHVLDPDGVTRGQFSDDALGRMMAQNTADNLTAMLSANVRYRWRYKRGAHIVSEIGEAFKLYRADGDAYTCLATFASLPSAAQACRELDPHKIEAYRP